MNTNLMISLIAFAILTLLWLGFGYALLFNRNILSQAWHSYRKWPWFLQLGAALLVLPVVLGLWAWNTRWPVWLRLLIVAGLAWVTEYTFFPASIFLS